MTSGIASCLVSLERITTFLNESDRKDYRQHLVVGNEGEKKGTEVSIKGASFAWVTATADVAAVVGGTAAVVETGVGATTFSTTTNDVVTMTTDTDIKTTPLLALTDINLHLIPGTLTVICGDVGSGKSALLLALLGELEVVGNGSVSLSSLNVAYCPQTPFILNASVRDNILFYSTDTFDQERYAQALQVCALDDDVSRLPAGSETEIGERGINLSGGQKARLALARALYSRAPLLLLDDCLSAVDARVARHLWTQALRGPLASGRTIVLATHALSFLPHSDSVIAMENGRIVASGGFKDLVSGNSDATNTSTYNIVRNAVNESLRIDALLVTTLPTTEEGEAKASTTFMEQVQLKQKSDAVGESSGSASGAGTIITVEDRVRGSIGASLFLLYIRSFGSTSLTTIGFSAILIASARVGTDIWLAAWSNDALNLIPTTYVSAYAGLSGITALLLLAHAFAWAIGGVYAARKAHDSMLARVLRAPLLFFDSTPLGRILNRFGPDIAALDEELPTAFAGISTLGGRFFATIVVQAILLPWTLIGALPLLVCFLGFLAIYRASARELRRLDSASKSLGAAALAEALVGAAAINNTSGAISAVTHAFCHALDINTSAFWRKNLVNRWLGLRLDTLGCIGSFGFVGLAIVLTAGTPNAPSPAFVGLALAYSSGIAGQLNSLVRNLSETESSLTCAERVAAWSSLPIERAPRSKPSPPSNWPSRGEIICKSVTVRYRPELTPALNNISLTIPAGSRVAICGRTGSGKSTLALTLLRLLETEQGTISIDDVDIATIGLDDLRERLTLVPQDTTLFSGTLRDALDPLNHYEDVELTKALSIVKLSLPGGLDARIETGGNNVSAGERQLVAVARALLRRSKVVILDESTASLDTSADEALQLALRSALTGVTVLSIVHRVLSTLDSDLIIVLDEGKVEEIGSPTCLLANQSGHYAALVRAAREAGKL